MHGATAIRLIHFSGQLPHGGARVKTVRVTARLPSEVVTRLDGLAEMAGLSNAELLRMVPSRTSGADLLGGLAEKADRRREAHGITAVAQSTDVGHQAGHEPKA